MKNEEPERLVDSGDCSRDFSRQVFVPYTNTTKQNSFGLWIRLDLEHYPEEVLKVAHVLDSVSIKIRLARGRERMKAERDGGGEVRVIRKRTKSDLGNILRAQAH